MSPDDDPVNVPLLRSPKPVDSSSDNPNGGRDGGIVTGIGSSVEKTSERDICPLPIEDDTSLSGEKTDKVESEPPTQWKGLVICASIMYLTTTMGQSLAVAGWPYLRVLDPRVPVSFTGFVQASTKMGHACGTLGFAIHAYTAKTFRKALLLGRVLSVIGCTLYIFIEVIPQDYRRYAYLLKFLLQAIAEGSLVVIRSYVPRMSRLQDRQKSFSIIEGANMLAIVSGPLVQLGCTALEDKDDLVLFNWLKFNMYTVPIWISLILNCVTLYIVAFHFKEPELSEIEGEEQLSLCAALKQAWTQLKKLNTRLVALCFFEKSISSYGFAAMYTIMAPYVTETFNTSGSKALIILSIGQSIAGLISLTTVAVFVFTPLARKAKARYLFPFALTCYMLMFAASFPIQNSPIAEFVPIRNETSAPFGCDASRYTWCDDLYITQKELWLAICCTLFGIAIPVSLIAFDTVYSHVLGSIDQNIMQGALIIMDDTALAGAPVLSAWSFTHFGPGPMWLSVSALMSVGLIIWTFMLPRLKKLGI